MKINPKRRKEKQMKLELIKTADVYADENNPRRKFDGIPELAASFEYNAERPGEPFTPPIVVRDGGIYRIVDGERRVRALKLRKAAQFHANVCDTLDEANALVAMLATDDKQPLTAEEKSRGVQQMLLLGVDPVAVDKSARLAAGTGRKVKRALQAVGDATAAEDMSLDWLLAINDTADDPEAQAALMDATAATWPTIYNAVLRERAAAKLREEFLGVAFVFNIPMAPDGERPERPWVYERTFGDPDALREWLNAEENSGAEFMARLMEYGGRVDLTLYRNHANDPEENEPETDADAQARDDWREQADRMARRMFAFFDGILADPAKGAPIKQKALDRFWADNDACAASYRDYAGVEHIAGTAAEAPLALGFESAFKGANPSYWAYSSVTAAGVVFKSWNIAEARTLLDIAGAMVESGYTPDEYEQETLDVIAEAVGEYDREQAEKGA